MEKKLLFVNDTRDCVEVFAYFDQAVYPENCDVPLPVATVEADKTYVLTLPFPIVSPRIYQKGSRLSAALGMDPRLFADLCRGKASIVEADSEVFRSLRGEDAKKVIPFRDAMIVRSLVSKGYRGAAALRFLCERYLEGLTLREDAVVQTVRVSPEVTEAIFKGEKDFMRNEAHAQYVKVFVRAKRIMRLSILSAPDIILYNEKRMLQCAIEGLVSVSDYPIE